MHNMARYFKSINKKSVQIDVFHGWDIKLKQWFVDVKMSGFIGGNIKQLFKSEESYNSFLKKFLG